MRILRGLDALRRPPQRAVVTIGMFDGLHLAHQRLIRAAVRLADRLGGTSVVVTFDPDPQHVLDPQRAPQPLMSLEARAQLIKSLGADLVWIIPFTRRFSRISPEAFIRTILLRRLRAVCVVVGEPFAFGKDRRGNLRFLQAQGRRHGMRVVALPPVLRGGRPVSSSRIRQLVRMGDLEGARRLLGRPVELHGTVVRGEGRASGLGFPTANIRLADVLLPPRGVYTVRLSPGIQAAHPHRGIPGVMNVGVRPTFGSGPLACEAHLIGFRGNLYGKPVTIGLLRRLRDEQRFDSPEALARQIKRDVARLRIPRFV